MSKTFQLGGWHRPVFLSWWASGLYPGAVATYPPQLFESTGNLMRFLKEPLAHFLLIGVAIFAWFYWISPPSEEQAPQQAIVVDDNDVSMLASRFSASWNRAPSPEELQRLVDGLVREEILVREARNLGLDRGDPVIRARLAQKMEFLTRSIAAAVVPEDAELAAYLQDNPNRFRTPPKFAFEQIFLGEAPGSADVEAAQSALAAGNDPMQVGLPTLLPKTVPLSSARAIDSTFGRGFSEILATLPSGAWAGPVLSGYGQHLARITAVEPGVLPPLDDVRDAVLQDWRRQTAADLAEAQYQSLADRYEISLPALEPQE